MSDYLPNLADAGSNNEGLNGDSVNLFGEVDVPFSAETTIVSFTVPATRMMNITGFKCWGEYVGEVFLRVDGVQKGGSWSSAAEITVHEDYLDAPIPAVAGQVVTVSIIQYKTATRHFKANLYGGLS